MKISKSIENIGKIRELNYISEYEEEYSAALLLQKEYDVNIIRLAFISDP